MQIGRRMVLGAPALLGLAGCVDGGGGTVSLLEGQVRSPDSALALLPPAVREAFQRNPALAGQPVIGVNQLVSAADRTDGVPYLVQRDFSHAGGLTGIQVRIMDRTYTSTNSISQLSQPSAGLGVAELRWDFVRNLYTDTSGIITAVRAEGRFPTRKGDARVVDYTRVALDPGGQPTGVRSEHHEEVKVDQSYTAPGLWAMILNGTIAGEVRPWMLEQPSFLMGPHHGFVRSGSITGTYIVSDLYGLPVMAYTVEGWRQANNFGQGDRTAIRLAGESLTLSSAGLARQREARADLDAAIFLRAARATAATPAQRAAATPALQQARQAWASRDWAAAKTALEAALPQDHASAPALLLYADTIRRWVGPRPSLKATAADRLAVYYARVALTMAPEGPSAAAAREMLAQLPQI